MSLKCTNCNKIINRKPRKNQINHFCSRSCSITYNNRTRPKRKPEGNCFDCGTPISTSRKRCKSCHESNKDITLAEALYDSKTRSNLYGSVRGRARTIAKSLGWNKCIKCSYGKHVEIAHKKPISDFALDTKLSVINNPKNLMALCPNCHWEHDHLL